MSLSTPYPSSFPRGLLRDLAHGERMPFTAILRCWDKLSVRDHQLAEAWAMQRGGTLQELAAREASPEGVKP